MKKLASILLIILLCITSAYATEPAPVTVPGRPEEGVSGPGYAYDLSGIYEVDGVELCEECLKEKFLRR